MNEQSSIHLSDDLFRMRNDLRTGIERFVTSHRTTEEALAREVGVLSDELIKRLQTSPQECLTDERPSVRSSALVKLSQEQSLTSECLRTIQLLALEDCDQGVRGLAILTILRFSRDIQNPIFASLAEDYACVDFNYIVEILNIIRGAHQGLHQAYSSLDRIANMINTLISKKDQLP
jgi:hypothetical protein